MQFWKNYQARKEAREFLASARKLVRMNRDIMNSGRLDETIKTCDALEMAIKQKNMALISKHSEVLDDLLGKEFPKGKFAWLQENVEVFLVAVIVAMAVRTFFIQPFKIPTGSMQPTLYGIHPPEPEAPASYDGNAPSILEMVWGTVMYGRMYKSTGYRDRGDHIFVDRFTYHFRKPKHGEVVVFTTQNITDIPESSRGKFYIKRLIAMGGETVTIKPPFVEVNGERLEGSAFERIYSMQNHYNGYVLPDGLSYFGGPAPHLSNRKPTYRVPEKSLFVLGDNSRSSLDGRFWGSVPEKDLVGRAFMVYWPFTRRFGPID
jgi:signal peptidase I